MSELDDLLASARRAEPDPLSDEAADALVREARRASDGPPSALDALVADARRADIDALSDLEVRRVAERAAMTGRARHRRWTRRRVMMASGVAGR